MLLLLIYCWPLAVLNGLDQLIKSLCYFLSGSAVDFSQNHRKLKIFILKRQGLNPAPGFGFCMQQQEFPSSHPYKHYPGPKVLNFRAQTGTGVNSLTRSSYLGSVKTMGAKGVSYSSGLTC